ncbi:LysM peptidoglycan-binding domain-containing protein [Paludibacter sp. 221]|nr:LysM peptidoglycan-binding domain-containing protein [Paludibacter sp. 221]
MEPALVFDTTGVIPDNFDYMLDYMLHSWVVQRSQKPECNGNGEIVQTSDSLYIRRLASLPHVIEMPYNKLVRNLIETYTDKKRTQLEYMLGISEYYFPIFEQALEANKLPLELKYLPVIESALNTKAVSPMGATGLWQFMIGTGRLYGLEINSLVDERMDPIKSTNAAIRFLKDLYSVYGDWHLAIAAYNCGPGNVNKAIRRAGGKRDFWEIYPFLPRETRGYVPVFIAANYAMNFNEQHNICPAKVEMPVLTDTIMVSNRIHLEQVASILNIPIEQIRTLNPQYRRDIIPGDIQPYALCLPLQYASAYIENCDSICQYRADELVNNRRKEIEIYRASAPGGSGNLIYHKVKTGDTLSGIAVKYGTSASRIRSWNNLSGSRIYTGQRLKIYK